MAAGYSRGIFQAAAVLIGGCECNPEKGKAARGGVWLRDRVSPHAQDTRRPIKTRYRSSTAQVFRSTWLQSANRRFSPALRTL